MAEVDLLDERTLAEMLGVTRTTLQNWRNARTGPSFIRLGERMIRYRRDVVLQWLAEKTVKSEVA